MQRIFVADKSQGGEENTAAQPPDAKAAAKPGEVQATFSKAMKISADETQADLDEEIAKMVSEGGPNC